MSKASRAVQEWFKYAKEDLITAQLLQQTKNKNTWRSITFHSQQCVEKSLKGYLTFQKIKFDKTHDIESLWSLANKDIADLTDLFKKADRLTQYAVEFRYPDAIREELTEKEVLEAITLAQQVLHAVAFKIPFASDFKID